MNTENQITSPQWTEAVGRAHNYCTAIDRRGGTPVDAVRSYGLFKLDHEPSDWDKAELIIALAMCKPSKHAN
jgi:hypothetical protein